MQTLKQIRERIKSLTDKAGQEIDEGIFELIVGLQAFGIPTQFSCFGHADKNWSYPHVDICADDSAISFDDFSEEMIEAKSAWIKENTIILSKLIALLDEFYSHNPKEYKNMLVPHCSVDLVQIRLKSIGADTLKNMPSGEFEKELKTLQKEMCEFAKFLAEKFKRERIEEIKKELAVISQKDEEIGMGKVDLDDEVFEKSAERLEEIIDEIGWPTRSMLGNVAAAQAWSIVTWNPSPRRHAKYLKLIKASEEMMKEKSYVAHFEDQLRTCSGEPELYGTGFAMDEDGKYKPFPLENIEGINERRAKMNLESYETFLARIDVLNNGDQF